jgi:hypothetical protein
VAAGVPSNANCGNFDSDINTPQGWTESTAVILEGLSRKIK